MSSCLWPQRLEFVVRPIMSHCKHHWYLRYFYVFFVDAQKMRIDCVSGLCHLLDTIDWYLSESERPLGWRLTTEFKWLRLSNVTECRGGQGQGCIRFSIKCMHCTLSAPTALYYASKLLKLHVVMGHSQLNKIWLLAQTWNQLCADSWV